MFDKRPGTTPSRAAMFSAISVRRTPVLIRVMLGMMVSVTRILAARTVWIIIIICLAVTVAIFGRSEGMSSRGISSLSAKRRGADWVQVFHCCRRRHPTLFFIKRVCNNDFGVFRKSPEAKFRSGSLEKPPGSHIGHQKSIFSKKQKSPKSNYTSVDPKYDF